MDVLVPIWCAVAAVPMAIALLPVVMYLRQGRAEESGA